ncbi:M23 family metallopeptidase [Cellulomonas timonensis]|uniref:M23 family metallopeptidase n=1 Tax=Cellulomonas timonensis TaxID=1689271 RepID=UPI0009EF4881|nr:M23 family metallopeptidase [Cellulomonas timonensis]
MAALTSGITSTLAVVALAGALAYGAVVVGPSATDAADSGPAAGHGEGDDARGRPGGGATAPTPRGDYLVPTATLTVLRAFERPPAAWAAGHRGVDLAASTGEQVRAPADGTVAFVGLVVDRRVLAIAHPDGRRSTLEPVASDLSPGAVVRQGDAVGHVEPGAGHCAPLSCVHWGVREGEAYLDPLTLIEGGGPVVLLP